MCGHLPPDRLLAQEPGLEPRLAPELVLLLPLAAMEPSPHIAVSLLPTYKAAASLRFVLPRAGIIPESSAAAPRPCSASRTAPGSPPAASDPAASLPPASVLRSAPALPVPSMPN